MASASSSAQVSVIGSQFIAQDKFDIILDNQSTGNFLISDINHNILLKVKSCDTFIHFKRLLLDAHDKPIVTFKRQGWSWRAGMDIFRGDSKNKSDLIFTTKLHSRIPALNGAVDVFLGNKDSGNYDFQVSGDWPTRNCTIKRGDTSATIAQMCKMETPDKKKPNKKKFDKNKFIVTIYPGVDYALVVTLLAIMEAIENLSNNSKGMTIPTKASDFVDALSNLPS